MKTLRLKKNPGIPLQAVLLLLSVALLTTSCSSVRVSQDYVTTTSFTEMKSYNWNYRQQNLDDQRFPHDELLTKRFRTAIEDVLLDRGLRKSDHPGYLVSYSYRIDSRVQTEYLSPIFGFGYGRYLRHGRVGVEMGYIIQQYDLGKLMIRIHSAESGELLWKGTGTREVQTHSSPEQLNQRVKELVRAVLAQFPPAG